MQEEYCGSSYASPIKFVNCKNNAEIIGNEYAAGILSTDAIGSTTFINCSVDSKTNIKSTKYAGGVFGCSTNRTNIKVYNSYVQATIYSDKYAGGIIGYGRSNSIVENTYFAGNIEGGANIGGIFGGIPSDVTNLKNCYYINIVDKAISNVDESAITGVAALSEKDMRVDNTLLGYLQGYANSEIELLPWIKNTNEYPKLKE